MHARWCVLTTQLACVYDSQRKARKKEKQRKRKKSRGKRKRSGEQENANEDSQERDECFFSEVYVHTPPPAVSTCLLIEGKRTGENKRKRRKLISLPLFVVFLFLLPLSKNSILLFSLVFLSLHEERQKMNSRLFSNLSSTLQSYDRVDDYDIRAFLSICLFSYYDL